MLTSRKFLAATALTFTLASCASPNAGLFPQGAPAAGPVAPAPTGPAAAPAPVPALPPAPPMAADARARLVGVVLFNDTPVADASLTAVDLATGKAIALTPWSDTPKGLKLLSTQKTDAKGSFDFELPKLDDRQIVKLIATKGGQTFTALFNSRGQALGADTPTTATYQLQQGQAVSVTVRLRLTAATTAATQAFEGVLKLTFQLPANLSADRQAAILEAARKAAQQVEEALAKQPEVAARLVATINSAGETSQLENFRTAVTNLGVFETLFKATQAELLAVAAEKLETRDGLAPIMALHFPLDRVVISGSGLLGFSGQKNPIKLGGQVTSNFVPSSSGGGGSSAPTPSVVDDVFGLGFIALLPHNAVAVARGNRGVEFYHGDSLNSSRAPSGLDELTAPIFSAADNLHDYFFGGDGVIHYRALEPLEYRLLTPEPPASGTIPLPGGPVYALAAPHSGQRTVYAAPMKDGASIYKISFEGGDWATPTLKVGEEDFKLNKPTAMAAVDHPVEECDILFVGTEEGALIRWGMEGRDPYRLLHEGGAGASSSLATNLGGRIYGLATCETISIKRLFVSVDSNNPASDDIYVFNYLDSSYQNFHSSASIFAPTASGGLGLSRPGNFKNPRGLTVYEQGDSHILLYGMNDSSDVVASISLPHDH